MSSAIREKYSEDVLQILGVKSNMGSLTYDGIELGGERVAYEIEEAIRTSAEDGCTIKKLSIVGYSLGGLVGRYATGLLYAKGYFDRIAPVNFTTFATPHVGVRSPAKKSHFWNVLGARTLSTSGRQLFMIDSFRNTGKPLLSILATPGSIFMLGLSKFKHRILYANVVNDRSAVFYTTYVSKTDPFVQLDRLNVSYAEGYAPIVLDATQAMTLKAETKSLGDRVISQARSILTMPPFLVLLWLFIPVATALFLMNSVIQTARSRKRIRLHEQGKSGDFYNSYRVPLVVEEFRNAVEDMYETVNATQKPEFISDRANDSSAQRRGLPDSASDSGGGVVESPESSSKGGAVAVGRGDDDDAEDVHSRNPKAEDRREGQFPILALTRSQFEIIDSLDSVGFRKYPVHIHNARHSHAAIIVRMPKKRFDEGKIVVNHWLEEEFHI